MTVILSVFSTVPESLQVTLLGMVVVFFVLIILYCTIRVLCSVMPETAKTVPAPAAPPEIMQVSALSTSGNLKTNAGDDETAALILSILADGVNIPLESLKVKSVRMIGETGGGGAIKANKKYAFTFEKEASGDMRYNITLNNKTYEVEIEKNEAALVTEAPAAVPAAAVPVTGGGRVTAPLPGTVFSVNVKAGDTIKAGQILFIIEAMKMENEIPAPADGKVAAISVSVGASVNMGDCLLVLE